MKSTYSRYFVIACIFAAATFGSRTAAAQAASPCSLLSSAQVTAAVGVTVGAPQPIANTGCSWSAPHMIVTLSLWDGSASGWSKMKTPIAGMEKTPVAGLGDDAVVTTLGTAPKQFVTLSVKKGGTAYLFKVYGPSPTEQLSMEKTLAANVLAKL